MKLVPVTTEDLPLYERMFYDPEHMKYLGGPASPGSAEKYLNAQMRCNTSGNGMVFKIVPDREDWKEGEDLDLIAEAESRGVGTVCMWKSEYQDSPVVEVGWGVLKPFQGKGFASKAVKMLVERALADPEQWHNIHTFTHVDNEPSVRMCKSLGFELIEECEIDYNGVFFKSYHYRIAP